LLLDFQSHLSQAMHQAVFVDLLKHAAAKVAVQLETRLPNDVAQRHDVLHGELQG
jgi:hypothetical protein